MNVYFKWFSYKYWWKIPENMNPKLVIPILHTRASHVPLIINAQNISSRGGGDWKMEIFGSFNRNANWELNVGKIATLHSIDASSSKKIYQNILIEHIHTFGPTHVVLLAWCQAQVLKKSLKILGLMSSKPIYGPFWNCT